MVQVQELEINTDVVIPVMYLFTVDRNTILRQLAPQLHIPYSITFQPEDIPIVPTTFGTM